MPATTSAQIVNIEGKRTNTKEKGWFGNFDLGLKIIQNTRDIVQASNRVNGQYLNDRHSVMLIGDLNLVRVNSERFLNKGFAHARYNYALGEKRKWTFEAFEQYSYNRIQRIDKRWLNGLGMRFSPVRKDSMEVHIGTAGMYEYEEIVDTSLAHRDFRLSSYLSFDAYVTKSMIFNTVVYYQPLANNFSDFRVSSESALIFNVTKRLEFRVVYSMIYDERPPIGVPQLNFTLDNRLRIKF